VAAFLATEAARYASWGCIVRITSLVRRMTGQPSECDIEIRAMRAADPSSRHWRLGALSCGVVAVVGLMYLAVIGAWIVMVDSPADPIGDPYLRVMEILTILSALGISGWVVAEALEATPASRRFTVAALGAGVSASVLTITVHFVQLTAIRQMWRAGAVADYRLIWPSSLFAVEYVAWDFFMGLTMILLGLARRADRSPRGGGVLLLGGCLCLLGLAGPVTGRMSLQNVAVVGYGVLLPLAAFRSVQRFAG